MTKSLSLAGLLLLGACSRPRPADRPSEAVRVQAQPAQTSGADASTWVAGTLLAAERAVLSTRLAARVRAVRVDEGDRVHRGDLLVRLDDDEMLAQLRSAQTALAAARTHERRILALVAQAAATQSELEAAQSQRALAEAQAAAAQATLGYAEIRAPFDGLVQGKRVQPGDLVSPGQPLLELVGGGLEIAATVSEEEAQRIRQGDRLQFEAADRRGEVEVVALAPGGDTASHGTLVRARFLEPGGLRPGSFARLRLPAKPAGTNSVWVRRSALVQRGDLTGVFVAQAGRAELRWLSLGEAGDNLVQVRAGLHAGELVIDAPGRLRDGQRVEVASAP